MDGTPGQRKIEATAPLNPLYVENRDLHDRELAAALAHRGELVFEKQLFDVFAGNRNAQLLLTQLLVPFHDVVLYGVYTEVCVRDAVNGLLAIGPQIHVVIDAIADIGDAGDGYRKQWIDAGVRLITVAELAAQIKGASGVGVVKGRAAPAPSPRRQRP